MKTRLLVTPLVVALAAGVLGTAATPGVARSAASPAPAVRAETLGGPLTAADALSVDPVPAASGVPTTRRLRTQDGRTVLLRGANVNALVDYGDARQTVEATDQDAEQARALGFTVVRLAVSWSRIEPTADGFDEAYLERIRATASRYTARGVYVLLDMHQDRYAAGLGASGDESDGAPAWAVKTDDPPADAPPGPHPYYGTDASRLAAYHFFQNTEVAGKGLQEHYADALARLAGVGAELGPGLAGVELYNEPVDPIATDPFATDTFSASRLWPLYDRLIARLRGPDGTGPGAGAYTGPIWFQPNTTRTQTDADAAAARFSDDPNLVYAPHIYTDVYNGRLSAGDGQGDEGTAGRLRDSFDAAAREADLYGAALVPDELPGAGGSGWEEHREAVLGHLDRLGIGGMVWIWKLPAGAGDYGWGVLAADGAVRSGTNIAADYGRPRVQAAAPRIVSQVWDGTRLTVRTDGAGVVDLWDGAAFAAGAPDTGVAPELRVDGVVPAAIDDETAVDATLQDADHHVGGRRLRVSVAAGSHTVVLGPTAAPTTTTTTAAPTTTTTTAAPAATTAAPVATAQASRASTDVVATAAAIPAAGTPAPVLRPSVAVPAVRPPSVSRLTASPRRFRPARAGRSGGGTRLSMRVSTAARVRVLVQRRERGRGVGARCLTATKRRASARSCTRWATVDALTVQVAAGTKRWPFTGLVRGRSLRPGSYRVAVVPTDAAGRTGTTRTASIVVLAASR